MILQRQVDVLISEGMTRTLIVGEAPGPLGADKTGVPFWGDKAGKLLWKTLWEMGETIIPADLAEPTESGIPLWLDQWSKLAKFYEQAEKEGQPLGFPRLKTISLMNAYPLCPTKDGIRLSNPTKAMLTSPDNRLWFMEQVEPLLHANVSLRIITLGNAAKTMCEGFNLAFEPLPHPSFHSLLNMAPRRGAGAKLKPLQDEWCKTFRETLENSPYVSYPYTS